MRKLIKFTLSLLVVTLMLTSMGLSSLASEDYVMPVDIVDFTTAEGFAKWQELANTWDERKLFVDEYTVHGMKGQVTGTFIEDATDGNYARFQPKEPVESTEAAINDFRMTAELDIPLTGGKQFVAFCYRISKGAHQSGNQVYFRDDTHKSGEFNGDSGHWISPALKVNGEWNVKVIALKSLSIKGNLKGIRIPIPGWADEYFDIKWIVCFNDTKALAEEFDIEAYHAALAEANATPTAEPDPTPTADVATEAPADETKSPEVVSSGCGSVINGFVGAVTLMAGSCMILKKRKE